MIAQNATICEISYFPTLIQDRLDVLARTASLLRLDHPTRMAFTTALSKLSFNQVQAQVHFVMLKRIEKELHIAIELTQTRHTLTSSWDTIVDKAASETASSEQQKRYLSAKANDYQRELNTVMAEIRPEKMGANSITSLLILQERLHIKEREVKDLKARLNAFDGLPPNLELAKVEISSAREIQLRLMDIREKLLGRMASGLV